MIEAMAEPILIRDILPQVFHGIQQAGGCGPGEW